MFLTRRSGGRLLAAVLWAALAGCFWRHASPPPQPAPQELYRKGVGLLRNKMFDQAREIFNKVKVAAGEGDLELLAQIAVGDTYFEEEEYEAARAQYEEILKIHSGCRYADYLTYRIGECHFWQMDTVDRDVTHAREALEIFRRLLRDFPESEYAPLARLRIRTVEEVLAENEFFIGRFYLRKKAYLAAAHRFRKALERYPEAGIQDKLLYYLYETYLRLKDRDHAKAYRRLLLDRYPHSPYVPRVRAREKPPDETGAGSALGPVPPPPVLAGTYLGPPRPPTTVLLRGGRARACACPDVPPGAEMEALSARGLRRRLLP